MICTESHQNVQSEEFPDRQIESESNSTELIEKNEENANDAGLQKKIKRKKSTSIEGIGIENESIDISYTIVQHENKRQKIEIPSKIGEDITNSNNDEKVNSEKQSSTTAKQTKDIKCNNNTETNKLRLKYENIHANTVQKLSAQADQLRMEISTLRTALANEQNAVRILRAQNDANFRKEKIQSWKTRGEKQAGANSKQYQRCVDRMGTSNPVLMSQNSQLLEQSTRIDRLLKEIETLKETNKNLAEQVQKSSKADRRKVSDMRQLKDEYELRLNQAEKASKMEINRLLEEIKSKKQSITFLQKTCKPPRKHEKNSMSKMRKKETESCNTNTISNESNLNSTKMTTTTNNENATNQTKQTIATHDSTTQTTCKEDLFTTSMPHEIRERIMNVQNELQFCKSKDLSGSDNDSALSSAPPSLSPQPGTQSNSPDVWQTLLKDFKEHENLQKEYELIKEENQFLNCEISLAEEQIRELEKVLQMTRDNNKHDELLERIHQLECKEAIILKESHELREQNELLEFRIIELEEGADKLLSSGNFISKQDACTETDFTDAKRPLASACICDANSQEQMPTDNVRKTLLAMSKHSCFDEQGRQCLLQVVSLLNNLEAMSQDDNEFSLDDDHFSPLNEKLLRFSSPDHFKSSTVSSAQSSPLRHYDRVVACVPPYSSHHTDDMISGHKLVAQKLSSSHSFTSSMNESGVFDGDSTLPIMDNQGTQTNFDDFPQPDEAAVNGCNNSDLCAEIQKLNKFRKKIEECSNMNSPSLDIGVLSPLSKLDETRLQYYRDRLELLENKVAIYESSGDVQLRRLAARLQNEIQLDAQVKLLKQRVEKLETINRQLDEERCELEEIENDTRLQLQRLEVDLEMLTQRNSELEMSCETAQANAECLQESLNQLNEQMLMLDADRNDVNHKLELIRSFMPAILLYHAWKMQQCQPRALTDQEAMMVQCTASECEGGAVSRGCLCNKEHICPNDEKFVELLRREQELTDTITEINRAYNETLERADNLWAQMEREYKDKLNRSQEDNTLLRSKINQLETRLKNDSHYAQERISQLEEEENVLKRRLNKLNRISRDEADKYKSLQSDFHSLSSEYEKLKSYVDGPLSEMLEKERKKSRTMEEEMRMASSMYNDLEQLHRTQMNLLKAKFEKCKKDLMTSEINNSELKEEVVQLEHKIIELNRCRREDEDRIKTLAAEAHEQQTINRPIKPIRVKHNSRNLAQELGSFGRNGGLNAINNLNYTSVYTLNSVASKVSETIKNFEVNREPVRHQFE